MGLVAGRSGSNTCVDAHFCADGLAGRDRLLTLYGKECSSYWVSPARLAAELRTDAAQPITPAPIITACLSAIIQKLKNS